MLSDTDIFKRDRVMEKEQKQHLLDVLKMSELKKIAIEM